MQAVDQRIRTGRWPNLSPRSLSAAAAELPDELDMVFDFSTGTDAADTPRFTRFTPPRFLRPSA
ncbi:MAG: hypothetical protein ACRDQB_16530 [Thermocrispum sp.]